LNLTPYIIVLVAGLLLAVAGHITHSRTMIATGLALIGLVSVYFGFVVAKVR
jgi:xanthosine utilization system XapX-like protein